MPTAALRIAFVFYFLIGSLSAEPRARDLGIPFEGKPGALNAITDVTGVEVGHTTLISGESKLVVGAGPVRTGVTAILPRGKNNHAPVFAGWFSLNGNGEMTGTAWIDESGILAGPVMLTNTHSVGVVHDAVIEWQVKHSGAVRNEISWSLPVVAETWDGWLSDLNGFHVKPAHVFNAIESAASGAVAEGSVGGGTGMICHEFKGGIGTASRITKAGHTVGVLVQANYGLRDQLHIAGVPVGKEIQEGKIRGEEVGSILIIVATDAPLMPHQLKRLARRPTLALGRMGSTSGDGSGDLFLAFSTANPVPERGKPGAVQLLATEDLSPLFTAVVQATEEAIVNALVAARTMKGRDDHLVVGLPHDQLRAVLKKYGRLEEK
ncbi:DmpA family aminopeptidase [Oleiharenicola lentus]|uniref:DmpA family aminopeptidase n=1 Tax=Oleiharenicola lentus TaxID=2508720 RepID=UPI003F6783CB